MSVNSGIYPLTRTTEKLYPHGYRVDQLGHWPLDPGLTVFLHDNSEGKEGGLESEDANWNILLGKE